MVPTRLMLDSMIFDAIADDDGLREALVRLVESHRLDLTITHVQADELASIGEVVPRKRLIAAAFSLGLRSVPTAVFVLGLSRLGMARLTDENDSGLYEALSVGSAKHGADAAIALTARQIGATLVTADEGLRKRARRVLPDLGLWSIDDLRRFAYARTPL